jgi:hypothetical protein
MTHKKNVTIGQMFERQKEFSENFFNHESLTEDERERLTLHFAASLQKEVGDILSGVNYRHHRPTDKAPEIGKIVHESVDAFRYLLAILNVWGVTAEDFEDAFDVRDLHLNFRHDHEKTVWEGQPVIVFDVDDVLTPFRLSCTEWVEREMNVKIDPDSTMYYSITEEMYMSFIENRQLRDMPTKPGMVEVVNRLYDEGYWIQLLTARPKEHLVCKYDTIAWLEHVGLKCHRVSFTPEKYLWLARTDYFEKGQVVCAVDDSAKHALEYAKHGIPTLSPRTPSNGELEGVKNIQMYDEAEELYAMITNLIKNN